MLKTAQREHASKRRQQERERQLAERDDPRPTVGLPDEDAEWLPLMGVLNEVISASTAIHPSLRDIDSAIASTSRIAVPKTHPFGSANPKEDT
jgi:hypothetical protein